MTADEPQPRGAAPPTDADDLFGALVSALGGVPGLLEEARTKIADKDQLRRFKLAQTAIADMLENGPALITGSDPNQREAAWVSCVTSVRQLWRAAADCFLSGHHAVATALSLSCLEEIGKLVVERLRLIGVSRINPAGLPDSWTSRGQPFLDHRTKHFLAAMGGVLINARVDRVLGLEFVKAFLDAAEGRHLEQLRQGCLYLGRSGDDLHLPSDAVKKPIVARYVALAGEALAEVQAIPADWEKILAEVTDFEHATGLDDSAD